MSETHQPISERVIEVVEAHFEEKGITASTKFWHDLGGDSLDGVELLMELEEEFDIEIPDAAAEACVTVGDAIKLVEQLAAPKLG